PGFLSPGEFGRADPNELFYAPTGGGVQFYGKQSANKQAGTGGAPIYVTVNSNGVQDFGGFKRSEYQILSSIGAGSSRATQRNGSSITATKQVEGRLTNEAKRQGE